jgi:hypothetical protein
MRAFFYILAVGCVVGSAYWAYLENIKTQAAISQVEDLQDAIGSARARLAILNAEWAYLNRPDRLSDLALLNFESLELVPMSSDHFGQVEQIEFYQDPLVLPLEGVVSVSSMEGNNE